MVAVRAVEDRDAIAEALTARGYPVTLADTVRAATDTNDTEPFDVIVLSEGFAGSDTGDLLSRLRAAQPEHGELVVAETGDGELRELVTLGATEYLRAPLHADELDARLTMLDHRLHLHQKLRVDRGAWEERLRIAIGTAPLLVYALDRNGVFTLAEGSGLRLLGLRAEEVLGKSMYDLCRDVPAVLDALREAYGGATVRTTATMAGVPFDAWYSPLRTDRGAIDGVVGVYVDATEHGRVADQLRRSEASFRVLVEHAPDAVMVHSHGRLVYVNRALLDLTGYERPDQVVGRPVLDLVAPEDRAAVGSYIREVTATKQPGPPHSERLQRRDGRAVRAEVVSLPLVFDDAPAIMAIARGRVGGAA